MTLCPICENYQSDDESLLAQHIMDYHHIRPEDINSYIDETKYSQSQQNSSIPYDTYSSFMPPGIASPQHSSSSFLSLPSTPSSLSSLSSPSSPTFPDFRKSTPLKFNLSQLSALSISRSSIRPERKKISKFEIPRPWKKNDDHYYSMKTEIPSDEPNLTLTFVGTIIPGNAKLILVQVTRYLEKGIFWNTNHVEKEKRLILNEYIPFHVKNPAPEIMNWEVAFMKESINKINEVKGTFL